MKLAIILILAIFGTVGLIIVGAVMAHDAWQIMREEQEADE